MGTVWSADIPLDEALARQLIVEQFPALAGGALQPLGVGWDNAAYRVGAEVVFRFPRRRSAAMLLLREARILPLLAPHLPVPIPAPRFVGTPTPAFPYPFVGYPYLPGEIASDVPLTDDTRAALAAPLGAFLRALHGIAIDAATRAWAPGDEIARIDLVGRAPGIVARLRGNAAALAEADVGTLVALVGRLATTPTRVAPPRWVHGDLYPRHLLLDDGGQLVGVIDWGDVHLGDPALDLSLAWTFLPVTAHPAFRAAYGPIDAATWARARFRAIHYGAILAEYGRAEGIVPLLDLATATLRRTI
jgi:aminoglycoside phosphotransferase (APT) family kinase protein